MAELRRVLICSDIHYASAAEKQRIGYELAVIQNPLQHFLVRLYRRYIWLRDPFAHNHLLDQVLDAQVESDLVVSNGDYSCDSAFVGVCDPAARQSAQECLGRLRGRFGECFRGVFGDHELGKISMCGGRGGLRLESLRVAQEELKLKPAWSERLGRYVLIAVTSSLVAMPVFLGETLPEERSEWADVSREHCAAVESLFAQVAPQDKVLLFCHDPTALPYLLELPAVRARLSQIERTIIGHLHSEFVLRQARLLSWLPKITACGPTVARLSSALSKARKWKNFHLLLCPALAGIQLTKRGGYYVAEIDEEARQPAEFKKYFVRHTPQR